MNPLMIAQDTPDTDHPAPIKLFWLCLLMITLLAGGMRMYKLSDYSFWEDELYSVRSATSQEGWQLSKQFGFIPTSLGLWGDGVQLDEVNWDNVAQWQSLGVRPFGARIGSCLIGILTIPLLGIAGRRLLGDRATLIAALLLAVSPWHLFWSQAARFYTLQFLFYNLALIWYLRTCRERSNRLAVLAGLAILLAYLSQPPALLISLVLAADVILCLIRRDPIRLTPLGWVMGIAAVVVCIGLYLYDSINSAENWDAWGKLQGHSWKVLAASMVLRNGPVIFTLAILSTIGLARSQTRLTLYLVAGATLPVLALMALTFKDGMYVHERYCFIVHYAWLALAALGLSAAWGTASKQQYGTLLAGAATAAIVVSMLWTDLGYYTHGYGNRRRWNEAFAYVAQHRKPGEDVAVLSSKRTPIARYYLETDDVLPYADFPTTPDMLDGLTRPTWLVLPAVSATRGELFPWLNDRAELKRYYDLRILQPFASIRVYYHRPEDTNEPDPD